MHVVISLYLGTKWISEPAAILKPAIRKNLRCSFFTKIKGEILYDKFIFVKENQQKMQPLLKTNFL